jgi:hypothetical protein
MHSHHMNAPTTSETQAMVRPNVITLYCCWKALIAPSFVCDPACRLWRVRAYQVQEPARDPRHMTPQGAIIAPWRERGLRHACQSSRSIRARPGASQSPTACSPRPMRLMPRCPS